MSTLSLSLPTLMAGNFCFFLLLLIVSCLLAGGAGEAVARAQDGVVNPELWCVAKNNAEDAALQGALDWACGSGGADCSPIQKGGACYFPSNVQIMASYAFNNYYLTHGLTDSSCYFGNTAALTSLNPSEYPPLPLAAVTVVIAVSNTDLDTGWRNLRSPCTYSSSGLISCVRIYHM